MHYNIRFKVYNIFYRQQDADFYNPINLHIFTIDDVLDRWIREDDGT